MNTARRRSRARGASETRQHINALRDRSFRIPHPYSSFASMGAVLDFLDCHLGCLQCCLHMIDRVPLQLLRFLIVFPLR
jgi:hypothetical protein